MGSTLTTTNLLVTITEAFTSNGQPLSYTNQVTFAGIKPNDARVMSIPFASEITVVDFAAAAAAGTFIAANVKYIRITNKDDTNFVRIRVTKSGSQTFDVKINPGTSFILSNVKESANTGGGAFSAFVDADNISAQADTSNVDIEYLVASI